MTTSVDHAGLEVLDQQECFALLSSRPVGRLGYVEAGSPVILPVNHRVVGRSIVFRTTHGAKLAVALMSRPVAFEVDDFSEVDRTGWSVLVQGIADVVLDPAQAAEVISDQPDAWADHLDRDWWVRVSVEEISGRRIPPRHD